ncbi:MAG: glycosyltransferase family 4 protein, partial [Verrucomicrobiales bacterium]|nr:glycosyltransferase family 4 protein [Verrucomicrobiales bacterium]
MRVAYCLTHPIQYQAPLIRYLTSGGADVHVIYGTDTTSKTYHDQEFGQKVSWDIPLLDGYPHTFLPDLSSPESQKDSHAHYHHHLLTHLTANPVDALWVHGWNHPFTLAAWKVARELRLPLLLRGETFLGCIRGGWFRRWAHRQVYHRRFRQVAAFLAVGSLNRQLYLNYGAREEQIFSVPYAVDNQFFQDRAAEAKPNRSSLRSALGIAEDRPIVLFCGKLIAKKGAESLIRAIVMCRQADQPKPVLLIVGDGELRPELERLANTLAPDCVRFVGFKNQTELPAFYDLCDLFVIPSLFEPWGLVVNEVMNAGKPVIATDVVGSAADLIKPGLNGAV